MALWFAALVAGVVPRRTWHYFDPPLPLLRTAFPAGVLTSIVGCAIGIPGYLTFAASMADANNAWMLRHFTLAPTGDDAAVAAVPYGTSTLTLFLFLFLTPTGLVALYLVTSGTIRAACAYLDPDDARGDFVLSGIYSALATLFVKGREEARRVAREQREGPATPDRLVTGDAIGVDADYVVLASRRKAEWDPGAIVMTSTDWYRLGVPFDLETPGGLRTAYPLKRMNAVEVVRRGIRYELPPLVKMRKV